MHQQAKLQEILDQILQNTPVLGFGSRTPPLPLKIEIWTDLGTLRLDFPEQHPTPPPPPPEN